MGFRPLVGALTEQIDAHPALDNAFYKAWTDGPLPFEQVKIFARNYLVRTVNTSTMVALSYLCTQDVVARTEISKNLFSEQGNGDPSKAHISLLRLFLEALLSRLAGRAFSLDELDDLPVPKTTERFVAAQMSLYSSDNQAFVLGAHMAQEWLAYPMLTRLYEGTRNYMNLFESLDEFHEHCEYFYVHIGEAEKEHKKQAVKSILQVCRTEEEADALKNGFHGFLNVTAGYWKGVADAMARQTEVAIMV